MPSQGPVAQLPDVVLLSNAATGATSAAYAWAGGQGELRVVGTISGSTVTLQQLGPDGATWQALGAGTTLTAAGSATFFAGPCQLRAVITAGTGSGLYVALTRVQARNRR